MNNKTKAIAGGSIVGGILIVIKLLHFAHAIGSANEFDNTQFKNVPVTIILTDSLGKKDTMRMEDYLNNTKSNDTLRK